MSSAAKTRKDTATDVTRPPRVRDRIYATACELFYRHGLHEVGVDAIAAEAGTNKMSFYRSFASKEALIAEYLQGQVSGHWDWWDAVIAPHVGDPRRQIEALFEASVARVCARDSRGCALANAAVEIPDSAHAGRAIALAAKIELRRRWRALARAAKAQAPDELGDALMLLAEGSQFTRLTFVDGAGPARKAAQIVRRLLDAYGAH